jgi:RHS repeat-associated protein
MFTGRRYDPETALYYYRARYYDYYTGRFLQTDPIGYHDGLNSYRYCRNNPIMLTDPLGLCAKAPSLTIAAIEEKMYDYSFWTGKRYSLRGYLGTKPPGVLPVPDLLFWDSEFWHFHHDDLFEYEGRIAEGHEVNYYGIGMAMKHGGVSYERAVHIVRLWKAVNIGARLGRGDYEMPTEDELYFLKLGHENYEPPEWPRGDPTQQYYWSPSANMLLPIPK